MDGCQYSDGGGDDKGFDGVCFGVVFWLRR